MPLCSVLVAVVGLTSTALAAQAAPTSQPAAVGMAVASSLAGTTTLSPGTEVHAFARDNAYTNALTQTSFVVPDSLPLYYSAEARRGDDGRAYGGRVIISGSGRSLLQLVRFDGPGVLAVLAETELPENAPVGSTLSVDLQVVAAHPVMLKVRTSEDGSSSAPWQLQATDGSSKALIGAGRTGMRAYLSTSAPRSVSLQTTTLSGSPVPPSTSPTPPSPPTPPSTPPAPPNPPTPPTPPAASGTGSAPVGSMSYPVPAGALFVATNGSDSNSGSQSAPKKTVNSAINAASAGGSIVVRGGTYYESVVVPSSKPVTVQSYPREAVWFDATVPVGGFSPSGAAWSASWDVHLDHSPTFVRGAPDSTTPYFQFVNPAYPMAAYPDQVWLDGAAQRQVKASSQVVPGTFAVDEGSKRLVLGSNPAGKSVRSSVLQRAFTVQAAGTRLRGIGIRNYASSVPDQGAVRVSASDVVVENVIIADSSTAALGTAATGTTLQNVTITGSGQVGVLADFADNLVLDHVVISNNNDERFNTAPVAGGVKITRSRTVTLSNSVVASNVGNGFWTDMATYDIRLSNSTVAANSNRGAFLELSSKAMVVGNVFKNNGAEQFGAWQTDRVRVWNNTFYGSTRALRFMRDGRTPSSSSANRDPRRPFPDPEMPWTIGNSSVGNNILQSSGDYLLDVQDVTHQFSAAQLGFSANGNVYSQQRAGVPGWLVVWPRTGTDPAVYSTVAGLTAGTGQERQSLSLITPTAVGSNDAPLSEVTSRIGTVAQPLPSDLAALAGQPAGTKYLGAWR